MPRGGLRNSTRSIVFTEHEQAAGSSLPEEQVASIERRIPPSSGDEQWKGSLLMHKVRVIVVSGFVGAGKTTLVDHLVQELGPARTAVMAEAGSVWVPEEVEANLSCDRHGARDPCSFRRRFADAIMEAARFGRCETILIENSGGTDPLLVANLFEAHTPDGDALSMVARLDHLITVIDAERFWLDYESGDTLGSGESGGGRIVTGLWPNSSPTRWNVPRRSC